MSLITHDDLLSALNTAIRSEAQGGNTSAADVRGFLTTLLNEMEAERLGVETRFANTPVLDANGQVPLSQLPFYAQSGDLAAGIDEFLVSANLRTEVVQGDYNTSGELTTPLSAAVSAESVAGRRFSFAGAIYTYMPGDAGTLTWIRDFKGGVITGGDATPAALVTSPVLFVQGYGQTQLGQRGNLNRPFASIQAAIEASAAGDSIVVLPGGEATDALGRPCYVEDVTLNKSVSIYGLGTIISTGFWLIPGYPGGHEQQVATIKGIIFQGNTGIVANSEKALILTYEECTFEDAANVFSLLEDKATPTGPQPDSYTFLRCRFASRQPVGGAGVFKLQGRDDAGYVQPVSIVLRDCELTSTNTPLITGYGSLAQRLHLQGSTTLMPGAGQPIQIVTRVNSSVIIADTELFIDERTVTLIGVTPSVSQAEVLTALQALPGYANDAALALRADFTWSAVTSTSSSGGSTPPNPGGGTSGTAPDNGSATPIALATDPAVGEFVVRDGSTITALNSPYGYCRGVWNLHLPANGIGYVQFAASAPGTASGMLSLSAAGDQVPTSIQDAQFGLVVATNGIRTLLASNTSYDNVSVPSGTPLRLRGGVDTDGVHKVFYEYSLDQAVSWQSIRREPSGGVDLYLKAFIQPVDLTIDHVTYSGLV